MENTEATTAVAPPLRLPPVERDIAYHMWFKFPIDLRDKLLQEKQNPIIAAVEAIKLGVLLDRNLVHQKITGIDPICLSITDFPPYSQTTENTANLVAVNYQTLSFLFSDTKLKPSGKKDSFIDSDVQSWFLRAVTFRERFMKSAETRELITLGSMDTPFELSPEGVEAAWKAANLPIIKDNLPQNATLSFSKP